MVNYEEKFHNFEAVCLYSQSSRRKISLIITIKFSRRIDFRFGCYSYPRKDEKAQIETNSLSNTVEIEKHRKSVNINFYDKRIENLSLESIFFLEASLPQ